MAAACGLTVCALHCAFFSFMLFFTNSSFVCVNYVCYISMGAILFERGYLLLFCLTVLCFVEWVVCVEVSGVVVWMCVLFCCV